MDQEYRTTFEQLWGCIIVHWNFYIFTFLFFLYIITYYILSQRFSLRSFALRKLIPKDTWNNPWSDISSNLQSWGRVHYARLTLWYHWLEGSQNAQARFSFLGETRFGYKARPWSVPTQMREVDQESSLGISSDQWNDQTSHQNLRVSLDSICDWDAWMLWANIMRERVTGKMGVSSG